MAGNHTILQVGYQEGVIWVHIIFTICAILWPLLILTTLAGIQTTNAKNRANNLIHERQSVKQKFFIVKANTSKTKNPKGPPSF